jgi:hypothetical protein
MAGGMSELEDQLIEDKAVLPLELFFDLVFVLDSACGQVTSPNATASSTSSPWAKRVERPVRRLRDLRSQRAGEARSLG